MPAPADFAILFQLLTALLLGPPLLVRGLRGKKLPETMFGLCLVCTAGLGFPMHAISFIAGTKGSPWASSLEGAALTLETVGFIALCVFVWKVYRPSSIAARNICFGLSALLIGTALAESLSTESLTVTSASAPLLLMLAEAGVILAWLGYESAVYYRRLRRQLRLGLLEPITVHRIFLAVLCGFSACVMSMAIGFMLVTGIWPRDSALLSVVFILAIFATSTSLWLICVPPAFYTRMIERRSGIQAST